MESIHSIQGYRKVGEAGCHGSCCRRARPAVLVFLALSVALVIAIAAVITVCVVFSVRRHDRVINSPLTTPSPTVRAVCNLTRFPDTCFSSLSSPNASATSDPEQLLKLSLLAALDAFRAAEPLPKQLLAAAVSSDARAKSALSVCVEVVGDAVGMINDSLARMEPAKDGVMLTQSKIGDIRTWLSSALTDASTCLDSLDEAEVTGHVRDSVAAALKNATELTSNGLAIATGMEGLLQRLRLSLHRKLLATEERSLI